MSLTLTPPVALATEDETFTIPGLSWEQYVAINDALGDRAGLRTLYLDGSLTFLSPAYIHEVSGDWLDTIIKAIVRGCLIEMQPIGSTTLRKVGLAGLEGDKAYFLNENVARMRGIQEIDPAIHPPPDLAIEVENSNKADEAMVIYAHLGVPEVWRHDVRRDRLGFWHLDAEGAYQAIEQSHHFPFLAVADVVPLLKLAQEVGSYTRWSVLVDEWIRDVIRPRLAGDPR